MERTAPERIAPVPEFSPFVGYNSIIKKTDQHERLNFVNDADVLSRNGLRLLVTV